MENPFLMYEKSVAQYFQEGMLLGFFIGFPVAVIVISLALCGVWL